MKLTNIKIQNFRGIEELDIDIYNLLTLIGPNNSGKSSVLRAIQIFLEQTKPELDEFKKNIDAPIVIEGTFEDIQDWERDKPGVSGLVNEGKIKLRATITKEDGKVNSPEYEAYIKPVEIEGWSDSWKSLSPEIRETALRLDINSSNYKTAANKERVREYIIKHQPSKVSYLEAKWTSENISISAALKQAIPQAVIIPAVKDAADDSSPGAKTSFGLLLKTIVLPAIQSSQEYNNMIIAVETLANKMKAEGDNGFEGITKLAEELTESISDILKAKVIFKMNAPDTEKFLGSNAGMNLDDGVETPVHLQGHGAQRALIYAMIENIAQHTSVIKEGDNVSPGNKRSTILLFEEPEIYLHPHLMRRLKRSLKKISSRKDWQVIITTHSPFFINVAEQPASLVIMSKNSQGGEIMLNQLKEDPFNTNEEPNARETLRATLDFHPTVAEVFFAERIVLVEGDSELAVLKHSDGIHEKYGINEENYLNTTIVSCGGKWTIPSIAKVLKAFGLRFRIIHDGDKKGLSDEELAKKPPIHPFKANLKIKEAAGDDIDIYIVDDTLENILWGDDEIKSNDKPYRAWCKIREIIGEERTGAYPLLKEIFEFAYNW